MNLNIDREWLLRMAEKEGNGIISVGGLVSRIRAWGRGSEPAAESGRPSLGEWVEDYFNAVGRYGPDSEQAKKVRAANADNPEFLAYADSLDRIKRHLGGSGMEHEPESKTDA